MGKSYKYREAFAHIGAVNAVVFGKKTGSVFVTGGDDAKVNVWTINQTTSPVLVRKINAGGCACAHATPWFRWGKHQAGVLAWAWWQLLLALNRGILLIPPLVEFLLRR